jgi:hypothetical protein
VSEICTGYVHVNHADDRRSYISLNELAFFNVITATAFVYVTLLSEAVVFLISEQTASISHCGSNPISVQSRDEFCYDIMDNSCQ